jgi:hypothetical protein
MPACRGMMRKQRPFILALLENWADGQCVPSGRRDTDMKTRLGSTILASLLFGQGVLGFAAVVAVLMKEPAKEHHIAAKEVTVAAQSAAVEGLISVR